MSPDWFAVAAAPLWSVTAQVSEWWEQDPVTTGIVGISLVMLVLGLVFKVIKLAIWAGVFTCLILLLDFSADQGWIPRLF